jgi:hypothetical protein
MLYKILILLDNKLFLNKFYIHKKNNMIVVESIDNKNSIIKIPVFNKNNGLDYIPICFPLELIIINNNVFNPYIILSTYNLDIDNEIDFFFQIKKILYNDFNLKLFDFNYFLEDKTNSFIKIINENYSEYFSINTTDNADNFIKYFLFSINIIKIYIIFILIKFSNINNGVLRISKNINKETDILIANIPKKILSLVNSLILFKYHLSYNIDEYMMTLCEYNIYNVTRTLLVQDIVPNIAYYISIKKSNEITEITEDKEIFNKVIKINVINKNKNVILTDMSKNIIFENYLWHYYHPNIIINHEYIYYQTYINNDLTNEIIKKILLSLSLEEHHYSKINEYYNSGFKLSNLISFRNIDKLSEYFNDINILKSCSYSDDFFEYITLKYSDNISLCSDVLAVLFNNYNYPLKSNRHELDTNFDHIIYFSLYNYNKIFLNSKTNDILHPNINSIIPIKLKNLYINLLKTLNQMINDIFESITFNVKFYNDYLYKNIIKNFLTDTNKLSINLFKSLIKPVLFEKFRNIVVVNIILIDITNKISWQNLSKKLNYLNIFYKNSDIIHFMNKINKNIIPDNFDNRLKKIIESPFEMYKYLRKEKDFIRWTKFISSKIILLYLVPISLSSDDIISIGKMIYLLFNIKEQNMKEPTYIEFINFCNLNHKIILDSSRINFKIREYFSCIKANINLGFLAKQLISNNNINNDIITLDKLPEIIDLETKLKKITHKYYKYKIKYLNKNKINKTIMSDTSSFIN